MIDLGMPDTFSWAPQTTECRVGNPIFFPLHPLLPKAEFDQGQGFAAMALYFSPCAWKAVHQKRPGTRNEARLVHFAGISWCAGLALSKECPKFRSC
jgi:hypothetical protein